MKIKHFLLARKLSKKSTHSQHKLGCCLVKGNRIIGLGFNQDKTSPKSTNPFNTLHAEVSAIINADEEDIKGSVAYVYRETRLGTLGMSKPCKFCSEMLRSLGVKAVYYTSPEGYQQENYDVL